MGKRNPLSKGIRFEVFKRDAFKCQYCGRSAPDVILEVDHIVPVSAGGTDDLLNLITSCRDCNRGKSAKLLSDNTAIDRQKKQLDDLNDIREQTEMLIQWKQELLTIQDTQIDAVECLMSTLTGYYLTDNGRNTIRTLIKRFGFCEVYDATEIAFTHYSNIEYAISKIGGICYNRAQRKAGKGNAEQTD